MKLFDAIRTRRSIGRVTEQPVSRELIEQILEAGTWAPNHFLTEPWKFFVMTGEGRLKLGDTLAEIAVEGMNDPSAPQYKQKAEQARAKALRAPVIITVVATPSTEEKVFRTEEFGAVHAAAQNMLLAAHALGLGAIWRTGAPAYHAKMKQLFSLGDRDEVVGFIYIGHPQEEAKKEGKRTDFREKTVWWES